MTKSRIRGQLTDVGLTSGISAKVFTLTVFNLEFFQIMRVEGGHFSSIGPHELAFCDPRTLQVGTYHCMKQWSSFLSSSKRRSEEVSEGKFPLDAGPEGGYKGEKN